MPRPSGSGFATWPTSRGDCESFAAFCSPEGRLAILEITRPQGLLAPFYRFWFDGVIPVAGKVLPGGSAYTYLPASVRRFPEPQGLAKLMDEAGFDDIRWRLFGGGIVALHTGAAK